MKNIPVNLIWLSLMGIFFYSCSSSKDEYSGVNINPPIGFEEIFYPEDNAFSEDRWKLGKKLFYDPILSIDSSLSCSSCHKQEFAFADNKDKTPGVFNRAGKRNAPTLTNVAYLPYVLFEGSVPTLEMQILVPIQEHNEFNHNIVLITESLNKIPEYVALSQKAYNRNPDPFVITRSISNFQRTLISGNSPFDQYFYQNNLKALTEEEKRGMDLFFGDKTNCRSCHSGFQFTNFSFENNGLYESYEDIGRNHFTGVESDLSKFKVPTLRNIELSSPYMHDGSLKTLAEVIEHYNSGGKSHVNKNPILKPLNLSDQEKADLEAFLKSLTDWTFINNPLFKQDE